MGSKKNINLLNEKGQSTVEYILLLVVIVTFITTVFNSRSFKEFFGDDSAFFNAIAKGMRSNYRYSSVVPEADDIGLAPVKAHPSFFSSESNTSRFFTFDGGGQPYPAP